MNTYITGEKTAPLPLETISTFNQTDTQTLLLKKLLSISLYVEYFDEFCSTKKSTKWKLMFDFNNAICRTRSGGPHSLQIASKYAIKWGKKTVENYDDYGKQLVVVLLSSYTYEYILFFCQLLSWNSEWKKIKIVMMMFDVSANPYSVLIIFDRKRLTKLCIFFLVLLSTWS